MTLYLAINFGSAIMLTLALVVGFGLSIYLRARPEYNTIFLLLGVVGIAGIVAPVPSTPYLSIRMALLRLVLCVVAYTVWNLVMEDHRRAEYRRVHRQDRPTERRDSARARD